MATPAERFERLKRWPLGESLFSLAVCLKAPYFKSISPRFVELGPGRSVVAMANRRKVHNHLGTVNAIAMCALCEVAAGTMVESTIPGSLRWIPRGMTVRYLKKATTDLTVTATFPTDIAVDFQGNRVVEARVRDTNGEVVMEADITMYVSPRTR